MRTITMPHDEKRELCGPGVTLNGEPATVSGATRAFATVTQIKSGLGVEFAWPTVRRIRENGGRFQS